MRIIRLFFLLAIVILLASCTPRGVEPQALFIEPEKMKTAQSIKFDQNVEWPKQKWWEMFEDTQLNTLIEKAMRQSPTLRMAKARVRQATGATLEAGFERFPQAETSASATRIHLADSIQWNNRALTEVSFTLDLWGREHHLLCEALNREKALTAEARAVELALQSSITRTYILLAENYQLLDVARETLEARQNIYHITRELFSAGMATELALSEAKAELPAENSRILELETEISILKLQIAALCGEGPDMAMDIKRPNICHGHVPGVPATLPAELVGRRPDIVARKWLAASAGQRISVAQADFYPNISLSAALNYIGVGFSHFLSARTAQAQFGPALSLPLFQGGRLLGQLQRTTAEYEEAVESYNEAVLGAFSAVATRMRTISGLEKRAIEAQKALNAAKRSYAIAQKSYAAGLTNYLEVLTAQNVLLNRRISIVHIESLRLDAIAGLINELGGGYQETEQLAHKEKKALS